MDSKIHRVLVVTGGGRGIGRAICRSIAAPGTHVYFNYLSSEPSARETESIVRQQGGRATAVKADVAGENEIQTFFAAVTRQSGRLDVLINNAASPRAGLRTWP